MSIALRDGTPADAEVCCQIIYEAFKNIAERHNFPPDFQSPEMLVPFVTRRLSIPSQLVIVAEQDSQVLGSCFGDMRNPVAGVGPITVTPSAQGGVGRMLLEAALERLDRRGVANIRLVQDSFNSLSFSLYTKVGFQARESLAVIQGQPVQAQIPGCEVRPADTGDKDACNRLCARVHGHHRGGELEDAIHMESAYVVERGGRITGYTTGIAFGGHTVCETNDDVKALIAHAPEYRGPGFLVPTGNVELLRWCYDHGLTMVKAMTLMSIGLYNQPQGAYLSSIIY